MKKVFLTTLVMSILFLTSTGCTPIQNPTFENETYQTLHTSAIGTVELAPDLAHVNIGVRSESNDVLKALDENITRAEAVKEAVIELGVAVSDIQTENFSVFSQQKGTPVPETITTSFIVENTISIIVRDIDLLGDILTAAIDAGANTIHGIQFNVDPEKQEAAVEEARLKALQNALAQGAAIAETAGVTLGTIINIHITESSSPKSIDTEMTERFAESQSVPISTGKLTITVEAAITFETK